MTFRNVVVRNPAHLSVKNGQLAVRVQDRTNFVSIEDTASLLIEDRQTTITSHALSALAEQNCAVYICDKSHLPIGVFLPFQSHGKQLLRIQEQVSLSSARKGILWQQVIKAKIANQAQVLRLAGKTMGEERLLQLQKAVEVSDVGNREAQAAQVYFFSLFGSGFSRDLQNGWNAALNYGYSIVRGSLARAISQYGLIPSLGIFHRNQFNNFNLADDFIEPFRPFVDLWVATYQSSHALLTPETKTSLISLLQSKVRLDEKQVTLEYATTKVVESYVSYLNNTHQKKITLPSFL